MAKDDREIKSHIRLHTTGEGGKRLLKGAVVSDPDELVKAVTPEQLQRFYDEGAITGTWKGVKPKK